MKRVSLAFLWHLHQPQYRLRGESVCRLPWVRLHAIRSYYDMIRVLDEFPEIRVTMNLVPVLLEQIRAYERGGTDVFLDLASLPVEDLDDSQRAFLFDHFFSAEESRMIGSLPAYADLFRRRDQARRVRGPEEAWKEFGIPDFRDLQALFDLAWFGFKAREDFPELRALRARGRGYTREEIRHLHAVEREILGRLIPLYRKAAAEGSVEISSSPYAHPILPLLADTRSAREALPQAPLPPRFPAPEDAQTQILDALSLMERELGARPRGMWPSEGSVSHDVARLLAECGVMWAASDEEILAGSDPEGPADPRIPWRIPKAEHLDLLFRDHELSDRVGFTYSRMSAGEAVRDFLTALGRRRERMEEDGIILVALDGENPWEGYPDAGADFLRMLYGALVGNPAFRCRTVSESLADCRWRGSLRHLKAGSWIQGSFGTWIGGPEKNQAWTVLGQVRSEIGAKLSEPGTDPRWREAAWSSLRAAEGSDWFWWLDGQFDSLYRREFDQIFRGHLSQAYEAIGLAPPEILEVPIARPQARVPAGALPDPSRFLSPRIDGFETDFFEWEGALRLEWAALARRSTMERSSRPLEDLHLGFSPEGEFLLRLDPGPETGRELFASLGLDLTFRTVSPLRHLACLLDSGGDLKQARRWESDAGQGNPVTSPGPSGARVAARKILELAVPAAEVGLREGSAFSLRVRLRRGPEEIALEEIDLKVPSLFPGSR